MEETFNDAIELAQRLERSDQSVYWGGYLTGLMRAFFGRQAVNNSQHGVLSDPSKAGDAALGYRDGYRKLADCPGWVDVDGGPESSNLAIHSGSIPAQRFASSL